MVKLLHVIQSVDVSIYIIIKFVILRFLAELRVDPNMQLYDLK